MGLYVLFQKHKDAPLLGERVKALTDKNAVGLQGSIKSVRGDSEGAIPPMTAEELLRIRLVCFEINRYATLNVSKMLSA